MLWKRAFGIGCLAVAFSFASHDPALCQNKPVIRDLTDTDVTHEQLQEILQPAQDGTRDLGIGRRPVGRPHCERVRGQGMTRGLGIGPEPVANVPAIRVLFAFDSAEILPGATHTLDEVGKALSSEVLAPYCFQIQGYTDDIGKDGYNERLSQRRAESVVRYLTSHFDLDADRLQTAGYGKRSPIADNSSEAGRSKNRRVQIANLGSGEETP